MGYRDTKAPGAFTAVSVLPRAAPARRGTQNVVERLTRAYRPLSWQIQDAPTPSAGTTSRHNGVPIFGCGSPAASRRRSARMPGSLPLRTVNGDMFGCRYRLTN